MQVHKEAIEKIPNATKGRDNVDLEIYGMEGIPEQDLRAHEREKLGDDYVEPMPLSYPAPGPSNPFFSRQQQQPSINPLLQPPHYLTNIVNPFTAMVPPPPPPPVAAPVALYSAAAFPYPPQQPQTQFQPPPSTTPRPIFPAGLASGSGGEIISMNAETDSQVGLKPVTISAAPIRFQLTKPSDMDRSR
ncbi:hypothetical protein ACOME3_000375 [Neoechinorhynchus agilis]